MKKIVIFILMLFGVSACSDNFLDLSPKTQLSGTTFYKNETQFKEALNGVYEALRGVVPQPGFFMDEMRSDNTWFSYYAANRGPANWLEDIIEWIDQSQTTLTNNRYHNNYIGITRANTLLAKIKDADINTDSKKKIIGQTLFLRAFFYYDLVTHYGGVPLQLKEVEVPGSEELERSSIKEVYKQIIVDLNNAIPDLKVVKSFPSSGRVTKGAARMLLAKVLMSKPDPEYSKAEEQLRDIAEKMDYSLLDNYADVFKPSNKNNSEIIFSIQYKISDTGQQSSFVYKFLPKTSDTGVATGVHVNDLSSGGGPGGGGGWNIPTQEMVDSYEKGDKRLDASIGIIEGKQVNGKYGSLQYESVNNVTGFKPKAGLAHHYFIKKYFHPPYAEEFNTGQNWPVFRYSGALLLLAECLVDEGENSQALPYINEVRKRAGLKGLTNVDMDDVLRERRHELAFENKRWTDLIRNDVAIKVMKKNAKLMEKIHGDYLPSTALHIEKYRLLYPIPFKQLQIDDKLTQNPGYH
jgi:hypothetical protein